MTLESGQSDVKAKSDPAAMVAAWVPCLVATALRAPAAGPPFCGTQVDGITTPGHIVATFLDLKCSLPGATLTIDFASE